MEYAVTHVEQSEITYYQAMQLLWLAESCIILSFDVLLRLKLVANWVKGSNGNKGRGLKKVNNCHRIL